MSESESGTDREISILREELASKNRDHAKKEPAPQGDGEIIKKVRQEAR